MASLARRRRRPFRLAVLSDLHLDRVQAPSSWSLVRAAIEAALHAKADHVVLAGDTFDCATTMTGTGTRCGAC